MSDTMNNIIAITNRKLCRNRSFDEAIYTALEDNVRYIIIREKDLSIQEYIKFVMIFSFIYIIYFLIRRRK